MSECVVPDFYSHSEPVARKQHVCCECHAPILPGEKHFSYRGKWDGYMMTGRQHLLCMKACMYIRDNMNDDECIGFGGLFEWLGEYRFDLRDTKKEHPVFRSMLARIKWRKRTGKP